MKNQNVNQISIINGEDGPTSIFVLGESKKQPLKVKIRNAIYQSRRIGKVLVIKLAELYGSPLTLKCLLENEDCTAPSKENLP